MGVEEAIDFATPQAFETWMATHGALRRELWAAIFRKASGRQTVTFDQPLEVALCRGWVDVLTKGIDDLRYGIRSIPRVRDTDWSDGSRVNGCLGETDEILRSSG
ncbi:MAG: YdeI/OmpD-associated family protein [Thermomicrobiales bacterium]